MSLYTVSTLKDSNKKRVLSNISICIYLPMRFAHNLDRLEWDSPVNPEIVTVSGFYSGAAINEAVMWLKWHGGLLMWCRKYVSLYNINKMRSYVIIWIAWLQLPRVISNRSKLSYKWNLWLVSYLLMLVNSYKAGILYQLHITVYPAHFCSWNCIDCNSIVLFSALWVLPQNP